MSLFFTQLRKEIFELWASRKTLILLVVMLAVGFLSPISAKLMPELLSAISKEQNITILLPDPTVRDALGQFIKNNSQLVVFVVLLLSTVAVVNERERGLMTLMFPHGLSRAVFVLGKFVALALLLLAGVLVQALATYVYSTILFTAPDLAEFALMTGLVYFYLLVFVALAVLASTLGQTTIAAAGITFLFVIGMTILGLFTDYSPNELLEWAGKLLYNVPVDTPITALLVSALMIVGSVAISCVALEQQEIVSATG